MASKGHKPQIGKKRLHVVRYAHVKKLAAGVALLAFMVIVIVCFMAGTSVFTITWRAFLVMLVIGAVTWLLIKILGTYEGMNRDKA